MIEPRARPGRKRRLAPSRGSTVAPDAIRLFVSYAHDDKSHRIRFVKALATLKREGVLPWFDDHIHAGDALDPAIRHELFGSDIFVALLSPDYLDSHYCWEIEYKKAMVRRGRGDLYVVAVVVRHCDWKRSRAGRYKALPEDGKPVTSFRPADKAWQNVVEGLRPVIDQLRRERATTPETESAKRARKPAARRRSPAATPRTEATPRKPKGR